MVRTICHTIYPDTKIIVSRDPHFVQVPLFLSCFSRQCHNRHEQWQLIQAPARPKAQCGAYDCTVKPWFCGRVCSASYSILTVVLHYNHLQQFCKFYFTLVTTALHSGYFSIKPGSESIYMSSICNYMLKLIKLSIKGKK